MLCIWGQFPSTSPRGGLYLERRFNGGFFALRVWGAYIWRGLYVKRLIFGILRYCSKVHLMVTLHSSSVHWLESQLHLLEETSRIFVVETNEYKGYKQLLVSLRYRTAGRRGRQNACVWQTRQGYYLGVLSWSSLVINVFWSVFSNKIIVTLVTQGLPSSFLSCPVA